MNPHYKKIYPFFKSVESVMTVISSLLILGGLIPVLWLSFGKSLEGWQFIAVCVVAFFMFAYFIDNKITPFSQYLTRAIYTRTFSRGDIFVMVVSAALLTGFLVYSFTMSKDSAKVSGINTLDGNAMFKAGQSVSDKFRLKEDSIKSVFNSETSEMVALIDASIQDKEKQKSDLNKMYGLSRGKRDTLRFELSEEINSLSAEKLSLKKERDSSYLALISVLKSEWGKDEMMDTGKSQAAEFKEMVDRYAKRFSFLAGWSIIIVLLSASASQTILLVAKVDHAEMVEGTLLEIPYNFGMAVTHNLVNVNRLVTKKTIVKEQSKPVFPFESVPEQSKKSGLSIGKKK